MRRGLQLLAAGSSSTTASICDYDVGVETQVTDEARILCEEIKTFNSIQEGHDDLKGIWVWKTRVMQKSRHHYQPVWFVEMDGLRQIFYPFSYEVCSFWYKAAWVMRWFFSNKTTFKMILWSSSCPTVCKPRGCSPPGSSVRGILQARILEWVALSFSRGSSPPRDRTQVSCSSCSGQVGSLPLAPPGGSPLMSTNYFMKSSLHVCCTMPNTHSMLCL